MLIREFVDTNSNAKKLVALTTFLANRAEDEDAQLQMSQAAFIAAAKSLNINVTAENLADLISQPPLSNVLEPLDPNSDVVRFKGDTEQPEGMSVDQAHQVVDANAKAAMKRRQ